MFFTKFFFNSFSYYCSLFEAIKSGVYLINIGKFGELVEGEAFILVVVFKIIILENSAGEACLYITPFATMTEKEFNEELERAREEVQNNERRKNAEKVRKMLEKINKSKEDNEKK